MRGRGCRRRESRHGDTSPIDSGGSRGDLTERLLLQMERMEERLKALENSSNGSEVDE